MFDVATEITMADVIKHLGVARTTAGRRLEALTKLGKIKKRGKGRGTIYFRK